MRKWYDGLSSEAQIGVTVWGLFLIGALVMGLLIMGMAATQT
jgi:hypothetical protein